MNAPDCDEPTVCRVDGAEIGFEPTWGNWLVAEERAEVSKRGKSDPKH